LDGIGISGDPVKEIPYLSSVVKGKGEALKVIVEVPTQIVDHALANADSGVVVEESQAPCKEID
jgi:hypothetical protein